jgi:hypothetical protein
MKEFGFDKSSTHSAIIFEKDTPAANGEMCCGDEPGLVVGSSEWGWISEDDGRRICAALKYFSETSTEEIERMADEKFSDT